MKILLGAFIVSIFLLFAFFSCTPPLEIEEMTYIEVSGAAGPGFAAN